MILTNPAPRSAEIDDDIHLLIQRYGPRLVAVRVLAMLLTPRTGWREADELPDHLRRDIGLAPQHRTRNYWDLG